jgi:hypothetical protein
MVVRQSTTKRENSNKNNSNNANINTTDAAALVETQKVLVVIGVVVLMVTGHWSTIPMHALTPTGNQNFLIPRRRRKISEFFYELGANNTRRAYRMNATVFWKLCSILKENMNLNDIKCTPNGFISAEVRISTAIRYFAGSGGI